SLKFPECTEQGPYGEADKDKADHLVPKHPHGSDYPGENVAEKLLSARKHYEVLTLVRTIGLISALPDWAMRQSCLQSIVAMANDIRQKSHKAPVLLYAHHDASYRASDLIVLRILAAM